MVPGTPRDYPVMANAGQLMGLATADVFKPSHVTPGNPLEIEVAGGAGFSAECNHDIPPLLAVRPDPTPGKEAMHNVMCHLMGHRVVQIFRKVAIEQPRVVTYFGGAVADPEHAGGAPTEIEPDRYSRNNDVEQTLRLADKTVGAFDDLFPAGVVNRCDHIRGGLKGVQ